MDLHAGVVPGNEAVPDGRMGKRIEETLMRGPRGVCQNSIIDGQKDGCNRDGCLYSDRSTTAGGGQ